MVDRLMVLASSHVYRWKGHPALPSWAEAATALQARRTLAGLA